MSVQELIDLLNSVKDKKMIIECALQISAGVDYEYSIEGIQQHPYSPNHIFIIIN